MKTHSTTLAALLAALGLCGCWLDTYDPPAVSNLPQRSPAQVAAYVADRQESAHAASRPVAQGLAGVWSGRVLIGNATREVEGIASGTGFVALASTDRAEVFVLDELRYAGGRFVAALTRRNGGTTDRYIVSGPQGAGRLEGLVLPTGWTLDDLSGGRIATAAERSRFGRLDLQRADPAAQADTLATVPVFSQGAPAAGGNTKIETDARGNLLLETPGCTLVGGIVASQTVAGVLEWAGTAAGTGCSAPGALSGNVTGAAWQSAPGRYTIIGTDGSSAVAGRATLP